MFCIQSTKQYYTPWLYITGGSNSCIPAYLPVLHVYKTVHILHFNSLQLRLMYWTLLSLEENGNDYQL
jgi:hypothetical protein